MQQRKRDPNRVTPASVEAEVVANILNQPLGPGTVRDLALPEPFVRSIAGRVLQAWFNERFRIVDATGAASPSTTSQPRPSAEVVDTVDTEAAALQVARIRCRTPPVSADATPVPPPSRNFAWPPGAFPYAVPSAGGAAGELAESMAAIVARSLAGVGAVGCAAAALDPFRKGHPSATCEKARESLRTAGLPTDLLACFSPSGDDPNASDIVSWLLNQPPGGSPQRKRPAPSKCAFRFPPTVPGFAATPDSGQARPLRWRVQLTRGGYYSGPGDGGSLDLVRQLLEKTDAAVLLCAQEQHVEGLKAHVSRWPAGLPRRITVVAQDLPLSQWAQDNGKPGTRGDGSALTLLPRFASRGEETSQFVPGDSCLDQALAAAGARSARSPLLFQGGNIIVVQEPDGRRTLLVGEAEIHRNRALGLGREHACAALEAEFGVDRCVVLPSPSIHIDYEVSVRCHEGAVFAFVNDTPPAVRIVLDAGIAALETGGLIDERTARQAREHVEQRRPLELGSLIWPALTSGSPSPAMFAPGVAERFQCGASDSGVGSFQRFLAAMDMFAASSARTLAKLADPHLLAFLLACARQERDRAALRARLSTLGWNVVPVPGLIIGDRSMGAVNGIHTPDSYLMPVYGGIYADLSAAAAAAISNALGASVRVVPILSGESQRRNGAVRCSVSVLESSLVR